MRKRWRPKNRKILTQETKDKFYRVFDLIAYWYDKQTGKYKPNQPVKLLDAVADVGFSTPYFYKTLWKYEELKEAYEGIKDSRRKRIGDFAEQNVEEAIMWNRELTDKEVVDYSFRMLEKTNQAYNPKTEIEANINEVLLDLSEEELQNRILELMPNLWKKI